MEDASEDLQSRGILMFRMIREAMDAVAMKQSDMDFLSNYRTIMVKLKIDRHKPEAGIYIKEVNKRHGRAQQLLRREGCANEWTPNFGPVSNDTPEDYERFIQSIDACYGNIEYKADQDKSSRYVAYAMYVCEFLVIAIIVFLIYAYSPLPKYVVALVAKATSSTALEKIANSKIFGAFLGLVTASAWKGFGRLCRKIYCKIKG